MPHIASEIVDVYVFRRTSSGAQFLVLRRRPEVYLGDTWQAIHGTIEPNERAVDAALREVTERTGLVPKKIYSADYINQFYDHKRDTIMLAPSFAALVGNRERLHVSNEYSDYAWCDLEETVARLPWSGQRWAARHIYDVIAMGGDEAEFYALT